MVHLTHKHHFNENEKKTTWFSNTKFNIPSKIFYERLFCIAIINGHFGYKNCVNPCTQQSKEDWDNNIIELDAKNNKR